MDEASMKQAAEQLGNGVTLVSVTPIKEPSGFEGATVRFRFDDITKLQTEEFLMPSWQGSHVQVRQEPHAFAMARPRAARRFSQPRSLKAVERRAAEIGEERKGGPPLDDPEVAQMVKALFKGFRIAMELEVIGQIVRTDADYVNGKRSRSPRSTSSSSCRRARSSSRSTSFSVPMPRSKLRPYLKDVKGLKINRPVVTVEFR